MTYLIPLYVTLGIVLVFYGTVWFCDVLSKAHHHRECRRLHGSKWDKRWTTGRSI